MDGDLGAPSCVRRRRVTTMEGARPARLGRRDAAPPGLARRILFRGLFGGVPAMEGARLARLGRETPPLLRWRDGADFRGLFGSVPAMEGARPARLGRRDAAPPPRRPFAGGRRLLHKAQAAKPRQFDSVSGRLAPLRGAQGGAEGEDL